jgi:hypothetical protein
LKFALSELLQANQVLRVLNFGLVYQLALFISKEYLDISVVLTFGYEDIYKKSVSLLAWKMSQVMNYFTISLDELSQLFRKLIEAKN